MRGRVGSNPMPIERLIRPFVHEQSECGGATDHVLHDIDTEMFICHGTDADRRPSKPVEQVRIRRVDGKCYAVLRTEGIDEKMRQDE